MMSDRFIDPSLAVEWTEDMMISEIPKEIFNDISTICYQNPVSNTMWKYLKFNDTSVFSPAANAFNKSKELCKSTGRTPSYTTAIPGTKQFEKFWLQEKDRCLNGYEPEINGEPCGVRISGEHYFYLNYCRIQKSVIDERTGEERKRLDFPDFCSMDFYWFLELEKNENPDRYGLDYTHKKGMIAAKARRKGYSFKNAAGAIWKYTFFPESYIIIGSFYNEYADATMKMVLEMGNFLNEYTEFRHPRLIDRKDEIVSGYIEKVNGIEVKKGYKSTIKVMTFQNSAYKAVGKSATRFVFEEAGLFENLKSAYMMAEPLFRDGDKMIGIPILFGTGGDMDKRTQDFSEMFRTPDSYGLASYDNIYEKNDVNGKCGWFIDEMWFRPCKLIINNKTYQGVDSNGNAHRWVAEYNLDLERKSKEGTDKNSYNKLITQKCKTPSEAFLVTEGNVFQVAELYARLSKLLSDDNFKYIGQKGWLVEQDGEVRWSPDLNNDLQPLNTFPHKQDADLNGCITVYEHPLYVKGEIPNDMYIIGHDPWGIDAEGGKSLGAAYVVKTKKYGLQGFGHDEIVAEYVARPDPGGMQEYNYNLEKLALYYNCQINFENDRGEVKAYFTKKRRLDLLCPPPYVTIQRHLPNSNMAGRKFGYSMGNPKMKSIGEQYLYDWLGERRGIDPNTGKELTTIDYIPSKALLEELIAYNRHNNFDRCFEENTKILTNNGIKKIKDIIIGDKVLTKSLEYNEVVIVHKNENILYNVYIQGLDSPIQTTSNHPFYSKWNTTKIHCNRTKLNKEGFIEASKLTTNNFVLIPKRKLNNTYFTDDELYLFGWYMGDGYIPIRNNTLKIRLSLNELPEAEKLLIILNNMCDKNAGKIIRDKNYNCYNLIKTSKKIKKLLYDNIGCPNNKKINSKIFNSSNNFYFALGFIEAEGHKTKNKGSIQIQNTNLNLMYELRQILIDNSIYNTISKVKVISNNLSQLRIDIPYTYTNKFNISSKFNFKPTYNRKRIKLNAIEKEEGFYCKVLKTESTNINKTTYNLSVLNDNTYFADNILVHNCMALIGAIIRIEETHNPYVKEDTGAGPLDFLLNNKNLFKKHTTTNETFFY
jgi:hypothetical protein